MNGRTTHLGEGSKVGNTRKWLGEGAKKSFGPRKRKASCIGANWGRTDAKLSVTQRGGATKGGASKCEQTQANADKRGQTQANASKRKQTQRRKRKQTQANVSKRRQTQTNAYTPLCCVFLHPPFAIPLKTGFRLVIFFSLTEAPLTDPTTTPPNTPKRTRNGPGTDPKRSQTEPNGAERSQTEPKWTEIKPSRVGRPGEFVGMGRGGGCKGKRISLV